MKLLEVMPDDVTPRNLKQPEETLRNLLFTPAGELKVILVCESICFTVTGEKISKGPMMRWRIAGLP